MSSERLKKVEEIFHAALELAPESREKFLAEACGGDDELRREVESYIAYEGGFDSLIDASPERFAAALVSEHETAEIGKEINQYRILSLLGKGGMGAVYLAEDTKLERKVAVKLLSGEVGADATRLNRFFQEAKSASALNHPNILTVHEIGSKNETPFIVTEYIKGKTLKEYLTEEKPPVEKILELAAQIASALSAAHEHGIIHRDIKPENIMVRQDGIVKILDFGIAKLTDPRDSSEIDLEAATRAAAQTLPGMIIGTPQYMSPEQARGQKIDLRSDIFSFGVVFYEMLAGRPPFSGATQMDVIGSILKDEPAPLSQHLPEISRDLEHIVEKTLRKDRERRYQHISDVLIDITDAKKTLEFHTKSIHRTGGSDNSRKTIEETTSIASQPRFSFLHVLVILLILSVTAGAAYWFFAPLGGTVLNTSNLKTAEVANWSSTPGEIYSQGTFSPDARMVAFASTRGGGKNIWVKQTVSGESIQITKDEYGNDDPVWSPTGEEIAFFSTRGNQPGIWRIPALGGSAVFAAALQDRASQIRSWSKRNVIYYESKNELYTADIGTGQITQITNFRSKGIKPGSINHSADENRIVYFTMEEKTWHLWTAALNGDAPNKIFSSPNQIKNVIWHPDGKRIIFSSQVDGTFQIFVTDTKGTPPQQITFTETDYLALDVSADGSKILYGSTKEESDIWGVSLKDSREFSFAANIDSELWADVSPDGKSIVYQSIKNLSQGNKLFNGNILRKNLNEPDKETLLVSNGFLPRWSPDGKTLAYLRESGGKMRLETINADGGGQKSLTGDGFNIAGNTILPYNRLQTSDYDWSPDSRKIAYAFNEEGEKAIRVVNTDGSADAPLAVNDPNLFLTCPLWSADGKRIAFTAKTNNFEGKPVFTVFTADVETKKIDPVWSVNTFIRLVGWSQGGKELLLASVTGSSASALVQDVSLLKLGIETKTPGELAMLNETNLYNIHLSPDKKSIAFVAHRDGSDNILTIPATGGEARKLTANNDARLYFSTLSWSPDGNFIFFGKQSRFSLLSMLTNFK